MSTAKNSALAGSLSTLLPALLVLLDTLLREKRLFFDFSGFGYDFWPTIMLLRDVAIVSLPALGSINIWLAPKRAKHRGILMIISGLIALAALSAVLVDLFLYDGEALNLLFIPFLGSGAIFFITGSIPELEEGEARSATVDAPVSRVAEGDTISSKSRRYAVLLCLLFGWIGLHRFYIGRNVTAIVQAVIVFLGIILFIFEALANGEGFLALFAFLFVWVPLFLWLLYDFITLLTGKMKDGEGKVVVRW